MKLPKFFLKFVTRNSRSSRDCPLGPNSPVFSPRSLSGSHQHNKKEVDNVAIESVVSDNAHRELTRAFWCFDANGDGKLSASEVRSVLISLGEDVSEAEAIGIVQSVDTDGDGFIGLEEFIRANTAGLLYLAATTEENKEEAVNDELWPIFQMFDLDRNGFITADELQQVLHRLDDCECTLRDCHLMIAGVDRNLDGFVDFEEFKAMMTTTMS